MAAQILCAFKIIRAGGHDHGGIEPTIVQRIGGAEVTCFGDAFEPAIIQRFNQIDHRRIIRGNGQHQGARGIGADEILWIDC